VSTGNSFGPLAAEGDEAAASLEQQTRQERQAALSRAEAQLRGLQAARKLLQDSIGEDDSPLETAHQEMLAQMDRQEQGLLAHVAQARANLKELKPPALQLQLAEKHKAETEAKLAATVQQLEAADEAVRKALAQQERLRGQKEAQAAKLKRLDEDIRQLHLKVGNDGQEDPQAMEDDDEAEPSTDEETQALKHRVQELEKELAESRALAGASASTAKRAADAAQEAPPAKK
jgi:chromosome segregation ATPase